MTPEIEKLIDYVVADGNLTAANKRVLYKKASELNVDPEEIEIVIDAKLYQRQQIINQDSPEISNKEEETTSFKSLKEDLKALDNEDATTLESKKTLWIAMHYSKYKQDIENKKAALITGFPNPRTKEEIKKFLSYAVPKAEILKVFLKPNAEERKMHNISATAWRTKCIELVMLSRFSFEDDKPMLKTIERYARKLGIQSE